MLNTNELYTIGTILKEYSLPVCIQKSSWTGDFYFRIERVEGNRAKGTAFKNGQARTRLFGRDYEYKLKKVVHLFGDNTPFYDKNGLDKDGYTMDGYDRNGYDKDGFDRSGFSRSGYDMRGFNAKGFNRDGIHKETGNKYDPSGHDVNGVDAMEAELMFRIFQKFETFGTFGKYYNDPIEWIILDKQEDKALLLSKYCLDVTNYNDDLRYHTTNHEGINNEWPSRVLRMWLNETFINEAFTPDEQKRIITSTVVNRYWKDYTLVNDTVEKIFFLSANEVQKYFDSTEASRGFVTKDALRRRTIWNSDDSPRRTSWWLRDCGHSRVGIAGGAGEGGGMGIWGGIGIRPAMWIDLKFSMLTEDKAKSTNKTKSNFGEKQIQVSKYESIHKGDVVTFGNYHDEKIEWIVLAKQFEEALIVSKQSLDCKQYNVIDESVTWETCSLRRWLNEKFIVEAFSSAEQEVIVASTISNPDNSQSGIIGGKDTFDKVFILSIAEANTYFDSTKARQSLPTAYAKAQGAYEGKCGGKSPWWLRSPGDDSYFAAYINDDGHLRDAGNFVSKERITVRPALWIKLESIPI